MQKFIEPSTNTCAETPAGPADGTPLSFAQERLWFLDQFEPTSAAFNLLTVARSEGPLDTALRERSIEAAVTRHAILRTSFEVRDGVVTQKSDPNGRINAAVTDIDISSEPERRAEAKRRILAMR